MDAFTQPHVLRNLTTEELLSYADRTHPLVNELCVRIEHGESEHEEFEVELSDAYERIEHLEEELRVLETV